MTRAAEKFRVLIPTTNGTVEVLLLTEEDPVIGRCVACIGGTTETADIAAAYHAFVARPTGVVESLFGQPCFRLDLSGPIDAGSSWQVGVLAAHALYAAGRLAQENERAEGVLWATGSVRPVDLTVGGVSHVPEKLAASLDRLKQEAAAGKRVILAVPEENAGNLSPALRADLAAHGIEAITLSHVRSLFGTLKLKSPATSSRRAPGADAARGQKSVRTHLVWAALAAVVAGLAVGASVYLFNGSPASTLSAQRQSPVQTAGLSAMPLIPENVPLVSERERDAIRDVYMSAPDYKAIALGLSQSFFSTAQPDKRTAESAALTLCRARVNPNNSGTCFLYASGNLVVSQVGRPPMPPQPWLIRDPSIETPMTADDIPLLSERNKRAIGELLPSLARARGPTSADHWSLAIASTDHWSLVRDQKVDEAVRRSLERCGYTAGSACMALALDGVFAVPIPKSAQVTGFFQPNRLSVAPETRNDLTRRLGESSKGWKAVAIGTSGRVGLRLGAETEQAAVDGALGDCGRQDRDCRILVIGPFFVQGRTEPRSARDGTP